jgi:hypothetical protein
VAAGRSSPWHRALGLAAAAALLAYAVTPVTGDPVFFRFNLRYTLAAQGLAVLVLATAPALRGVWAQRALVAAAVAGVALAFPGPPAGHRDPFELGGWPDGHRVAAVAATVAVAVIAASGWWLWRAWQATGPGGHATTVALVAGAGVMAVAFAVAGRGLAERYQAGRYRHLPGDLAAAWAWAQNVHDARIGVVGLYQQYPFTGADLSNYVQYIGVTTAHRGFERAPTCAAFRRAVDAGRYRYVVTSRDGILPPPGEPPEAGWTRSDPAAVQILHQGDTAVFELTRPLDPAGC